ncbi:MAG: aldehyde dehydrogenase [Lachnospiraceae bacterium]|nr:aldehyde dehydrogenase [Lachnospiraceae bacterium]
MKMVIDGQQVDSSNGKVIEIRNPATGELLDTVPDATIEDVDRAIAAANRAQKEWAKLLPIERANMLYKVVEIARREIDDIAVLLSKECGKPLREAQFEANEFPDLLQEYIEKYKHLEGRVIENGFEAGQDGNLFVTVRMPYGVSVCLVPFNYPVELMAQKISSTLLAGNTAIVKISPYNPLSCIRLVNMFKEAGVPDGVLQIITGGVEVGERLTHSDQIHMINFTGSTATGTKIYEAAAKNLTKVSLELGGNDAFILCEDGDIDLAVEEVVAGRILCSGQVCIATKRLLIQNSVKEEFTNKLIERFKKIKQGDPLDDNNDMGCMINEAAAEKVQKQVELCVAQGAKIALGGTHEGAFYRPTVLVDCTRDMDVMKDMEIFGPVASIMGFDTVDEAIDIANQSSLGLGGCVFTSNMKTALKVCREVITGSMNINASSLLRSHEMPFGGAKKSGLGREGVCVSFDEVTQEKTIVFRNLHLM